LAIQVENKAERQLPALKINLDALQQNAHILCELCKRNGLSVAGVLDFFDDNMLIGKAFREGGCKHLAVSTTAHLKELKTQFPSQPIMFLHPPMRQDMEEVVNYADIITQFSPETLFALDQTSAKYGVCSNVLLALQEDNVSELVECAKIAKKLPRVKVRGIGILRTGFQDVISTKRAMGALVEGSEAVESVLGERLEIVSAGHSLDILLNLENAGLPKCVNHLLIGSSIGNPQWLFSELPQDKVHL